MIHTNVREINEKNVRTTTIRYSALQHVWGWPSLQFARFSAHGSSSPSIVPMTYNVADHTGLYLPTALLPKHSSF